MSKETEPLLHQFILQQLKTYQEPTRRGVPRGEAVGLSFIKYSACLLLLTGDSLKDIAENLGISYGLLRKWQTEKLFKDILRKSCRDFSLIFVDRLNKILQSVQTGIEAYLSEKVDVLPNDRSRAQILQQMTQYSPVLRQSILDRLSDQFRAAPDPTLAIILLKLYETFGYSLSKADKGAIDSGFKTEAKEIILRALRSDSSEEERRIASLYLDAVL